MDNPDQYAGINTKGTPEQALEFAGSPRGNLILSQALYYAIKALKAVEPEYLQEKSNIADMEYLQNAFVFPPEMFDASLIAAQLEQLDEVG